MHFVLVIVAPRGTWRSASARAICSVLAPPVADPANAGTAINGKARRTLQRMGLIVSVKVLASGGEGVRPDSLPANDHRWGAGPRKARNHLGLPIPLVEEEFVEHTLVETFVEGFKLDRFLLGNLHFGFRLE